MRCKSLGRTSKYVRRGDCTGTTAQQSTCMQKYSAKSGPSNPSPGYMPKKKPVRKLLSIKTYVLHSSLAKIFEKLKCP